MVYSEEILPKAPALCSQRWNFAILSFFGFLILYVTRVNLSVAIICMVRAPRVNVTSDHQTNDSILATHGLTTKLTTAYPDVTGENVAADDRIAESGCTLDITKSSLSVNDGEFDWDKGTQSRLLAIYFYGYIFTQIPGGWLAGRYGGRLVWGLCQSICALSSLALPLAARAHVYLVYGLRFLLGLASGVSFPCVYAMMGRWAPKLERSKLMSLCFTGLSVSNVLTFTLSALLCVYGFDNGWGSIFYLSGIGNLVWVVVWFVVTADTPDKHKRISEAERNYIQRSIGDTPEDKEISPTPWRAIFTSAAVWACTVAMMSFNCTSYTLQTSLPTFMKEVLNFDIKQNGGLSALPYLCESLVSVLAGQVADRLRERGILSTKNTRKLFTILALLGSATCIVSAGYMDCSQRAVAVFLVCLSLSFLGLNRGGFLVNHIDLAPRHAGVIYGISNTVATVSGMVGPIIVGSLAPNGTAEEWRHVFYVCAAVSVVGAMVYGVFAEGELQSWAAPPSVQHVVDCHKVKEIENNKNRSYPITQCEDSSPGDITTNNADPMTPRKEGSIITEPQKEDFN
ncbi:sialin-like isoform X2 [Pomacea canaliculata]|uniref:sialin-like isoform X2 n=1 Tax=Pomacea canaliculata TaxID=400727 RepID=UPI000D727DE3|nr:sialin-like isoform X2 [Pomacea canaliculata]